MGKSQESTDERLRCPNGCDYSVAADWAGTRQCPRCLADLDLSNQIPHQHVYELKGGPTWWAECACGEKFNRGNGVVCGSRDKILRELRARGRGNARTE